MMFLKLRSLFINKYMINFNDFNFNSLIYDKKNRSYFIYRSYDINNNMVFRMNTNDVDFKDKILFLVEIFENNLNDYYILDDII